MLSGPRSQFFHTSQERSEANSSVCYRRLGDKRVSVPTHATEGHVKGWSSSPMLTLRLAYRNPTNKASSTVLLRQGTGPALLSVVLYVPERARASSAQSLDIHVVSGCSHQGCLHVSSNNMNHGPTPATA